MMIPTLTLQALTFLIIDGSMFFQQQVIVNLHYLCYLVIENNCIEIYYRFEGL